MHSKEYKNSLDWKGKHGVVVGTANTGKSILYPSISDTSLTIE